MGELPEHGVVLNAFRHREIGAETLLLLVAVFSQVLNAFRHRRSVPETLLLLSQSSAKCSTPFRHRGDRLRKHFCCLSQSSAKCSTPFGIGRSGAGGLFFVINRFLSVLNAFRHRRSVRIISLIPL